MEVAWRWGGALIGWMWKGRFQTDSTELLQQFSESVSFDWRLYRHDIRGSIAHARALESAGIISSSEFDAISNGLKEIQDEIEESKFVFRSELEDVHMNIESALTERIGDAGAKLHTARSRNDQVSLDLRLYCREAMVELQSLCTNLQMSFLDLASRSSNVIMPGYTHLQRGQPVLFAHHLLAYVEMLERDRDRLSDARRRLEIMPLGSGALAGSTINLNREQIAEELGFKQVSTNSMDAVSDRDFVAEILFALALLGVHLSRLSEDVVLWCSTEFDFLELSDGHTTGSSLMPQKKNPDAAELTRGKTGRLTGNLVAILTVLKGLPMTYNRDLQEDKEPLFDSIDTVTLCLKILREMMEQASPKADVMKAAANDAFLLATDLADHLVLQGVPFRQAHDIIGKLTGHVIEQNCSFHDLSLDEFKRFSPAFSDSVLELLSPDTALSARTNTGSPSPINTSNQIQTWREKLAVRT